MKILDGQWWTIDRNLTLEDTYLSAMATYIDCIKNGVTTIFDHHASFGSIRDSLFHIEKAAKETGVRSCLCYEISDQDGKKSKRFCHGECRVHQTCVKGRHRNDRRHDGDARSVYNL